MRTAMLLLLALAAMQVAFAQAPFANGEVTRINEKRQEITIKHGPIPHLAMDSMTMAFPVKEPGLLKKAKPGDKVRFQAEKRGDEAVITSIEVAK